eukprot:7981777-Lingulodinium_polyedra.AAC.1
MVLFDQSFIDLKITGALTADQAGASRAFLSKVFGPEEQALRSSEPSAERTQEEVLQFSMLAAQMGWTGAVPCWAYA